MNKKYGLFILGAILGGVLFHLTGCATLTANCSNEADPIARSNCQQRLEKLRQQRYEENERNNSMPYRHG